MSHPLLAYLTCFQTAVTQQVVPEEIIDRFIVQCQEDELLYMPNYLTVLDQHEAKISKKEIETWSLELVRAYLSAIVHQESFNTGLIQRKIDEGLIQRLIHQYVNSFEKPASLSS